MTAAGTTQSKGEIASRGIAGGVKLGGVEAIVCTEDAGETVIAVTLTADALEGTRIRTGHFPSSSSSTRCKVVDELEGARDSVLTALSSANWPGMDVGVVGRFDIGGSPASSRRAGEGTSEWRRRTLEGKSGCRRRDELGDEELMVVVEVEVCMIQCNVICNYE
jgi:hypothetical protein